MLDSPDESLIQPLRNKAVWDELIGGSGADRFYHHGVATGFGTEWVHDFSDAEGDRLVTQASGTAADFVVSFATTPEARAGFSGAPPRATGGDIL